MCCECVKYYNATSERREREREDCANRNMPTSRVLLITWERMNAKIRRQKEFLCVCSKEKGTQWGFQLCMCVMNILSVQGLHSLYCALAYIWPRVRSKYIVHSIHTQRRLRAKNCRWRTVRSFSQWSRRRFRGCITSLYWTSVCLFKLERHTKTFKAALATDLCNL